MCLADRWSSWSKLGHTTRLVPQGGTLAERPSSFGQEFCQPYHWIRCILEQLPQASSMRPSRWCKAIIGVPVQHRTGSRHRSLHFVIALHEPQALTIRPHPIILQTHRVSKFVLTGLRLIAEGTALLLRSLLT
jgi:hypothetical protein